VETEGVSTTLVALLALFAQLSLLAFGGGQTVMPEMQRDVVEVHGWMTAADFTALFALAQAAPGPNLMIATLIGFRVAGVPGAVVATLGIIGPSSVLTLVTFGLWHRFRDRPWRRIVQAGIVPVTVGLTSSATLIIARTAAPTVTLAAITLAVAALSFWRGVHPLWLLGGGAALGVLGAA
jgi:chromate transporter